MKIIPILFMALVLAGCAAAESVAETGEIPQGLRNTGSFLISGYCEITRNLERNLVSFIRRFDQDWVSVCERYFAAKEAAASAEGV